MPESRASLRRHKRHVSVTQASLRHHSGGNPPTQASRRRHARIARITQASLRRRSSVTSGATQAPLRRHSGVTQASQASRKRHSGVTQAPSASRDPPKPAQVDGQVREGAGDPPAPKHHHKMARRPDGRVTAETSQGDSRRKGGGRNQPGQFPREGWRPKPARAIAGEHPSGRLPKGLQARRYIDSKPFCMLGLGVDIREPSRGWASTDARWDTVGSSCSEAR
jgi:hypothetical protein